MRRRKIAATTPQPAALVAHSPLANGAPAGARPGTGQGDMRSWMARFTGENGERVAELSAEFARAAERAQMAPATPALACLPALGDHVIRVAGRGRGRPWAECTTPRDRLATGRPDPTVYPTLPDATPLSWPATP